MSIARAAVKTEKKSRRSSAKNEKTQTAETEEDEARSEEIESMEVEKKENTIHIMAEDGAAGQLFTMTALLTVRTSIYKRFSRDEFGKKIQPYNSWEDLPDREQKQEYTVAVELGNMPHALVPNDREMTFALPDALRRVSIKRSRRAEAEAKLEAGNRLRITGRRPGDTEFEIRYELAGKKLEAVLPVRVLKKESVAKISVAEDRRSELGMEEIDELIGLRDGRVVRIDRIDDPSIAQIAFDEYRVQVKGLKPGTTRAVLAYTGSGSGKGRRRVRCQTQVPLIITVK